MVNIPGIRTSDLVVVIWWRDGRNLWQATGEGGERSGCIVGASGHLVPVMKCSQASPLLGHLNSCSESEKQ